MPQFEGTLTAWGLSSLQRGLLCQVEEMGSNRGRGTVWQRVRGRGNKGVSNQFLLPLPPPAWVPGGPAPCSSSANLPTVSFPSSLLAPHPETPTSDLPARAPSLELFSS